ASAGTASYAAVRRLWICATSAAKRPRSRPTGTPRRITLRLSTTPKWSPIMQTRLLRLLCRSFRTWH
ncbi:hypothetical protein IWW50_002580, partial [Coemansia erecta]